MIKSYFSKISLLFLLVLYLFSVCSCSGNNTTTDEASYSDQTISESENSPSSSPVTINEGESTAKQVPPINITTSAALISPSVTSKQIEKSKNNTHSAIKAIPLQSEKKIGIGDYVQFGSYNNDPILWKCVDKDKVGGTMLISEYVICLKPYDAAESGKYDIPDINDKKDIQNNGSNVWSNSNIREWLNSSEKVVKYSTYPPSNEAVRFGNNDYDTEPGFLYNFTEEERGKMLSTTHDDSVKDKVYLLSLDEVDAYIGPRSTESKRIRQITEKAKKNSEYNNMTSMDNVWYWTRSPYTTSLNRIYVINENGLFSTGYPCIGDYGVLPALNLKSDVAKSGSGKKDEPFIP